MMSAMMSVVPRCLWFPEVMACPFLPAEFATLTRPL